MVPSHTNPKSFSFDQLQQGKADLSKPLEPNSSPADEKQAVTSEKTAVMNIQQQYEILKKLGLKFISDSDNENKVT